MTQKFEFTEKERAELFDSMSPLTKHRKGLVVDRIESIIDSRTESDVTPQITEVQRKALAIWIMRGVPTIPMCNLDIAINSLWNTIYPPKSEQK